MFINSQALIVFPVALEPWMNYLRVNSSSNKKISTIPIVLMGGLLSGLVSGSKKYDCFKTISEKDRLILFD